MTHPITPPPPALVCKWAKETPPYEIPANHIATQAARWGADQELEACCGFIGCEHSVAWSDRLRHRRRPKPPSLKQQALEALDSASYQPGSDFKQIDPARSATIRRAIESLPDPQD